MRRPDGSTCAAMVLLAGIVGMGAYMAHDTVADPPSVIRAETLTEALNLCEGMDDPRSCREAAYVAIWPDWMPECVREDAPGPCVWVAPNHGAGTGDSFIVTDGGHVEYVTDEHAQSVVWEVVTEA